VSLAARHRRRKEQRRFGKAKRPPGYKAAPARKRLAEGAVRPCTPKGLAKTDAVWEDRNCNLFRSSGLRRICEPAQLPLGGFCYSGFWVRLTLIDGAGHSAPRSSLPCRSPGRQGNRLIACIGLSVPMRFVAPGCAKPIDRFADAPGERVVPQFEFSTRRRPEAACARRSAINSRSRRFRSTFEHWFSSSVSEMDWPAFTASASSRCICQNPWGLFLR
jgi:hypothetical protein